jgi:hypothetical protein
MDKAQLGGAVVYPAAPAHRPIGGVRLVVAMAFTLTNQKQSLRCAPFRPIRGDPPGMGSQEPGYSTARI